MTYKYTFWNENEHDFIGALFLESDEIAKDIADKSGAKEIVNEHTKTEYKKCTACGTWEKKNNLINGLCSWCDYLQKIQEFIDFLDGELAQADESGKREELYNEKITLSFKDMSLSLTFGAIEYNNIFYCLEEMIKELKE